jgi:hypothetical protein
MSSQITPEQAEMLLLFASLILAAVVMRMVGLAILRWVDAHAPAPDDNLTEEERDLRMVQRRRRTR